LNQRIAGEVTEPWMEAASFCAESIAVESHTSWRCQVTAPSESWTFGRPPPVSGMKNRSIWSQVDSAFERSALS